MGIARIQIGVRKGVAVSRVLVGVDEAGRQHCPFATVEHPGFGMGGPHAVERRHRADAAVLVDVHRMARCGALGQQHLGADDQSRTRPVGPCRPREVAVPMDRRPGIGGDIGNGCGACAQEQGKQAGRQPAAGGSGDGRPVGVEHRQLPSRRRRQGGVLRGHPLHRHHASPPWWRSTCVRYSHAPAGTRARTRRGAS